jgi:hypothetical protein
MHTVDPDHVVEILTYFSDGKKLAAIRLTTGDVIETLDT